MRHPQPAAFMSCARQMRLCAGTAAFAGLAAQKNNGSKMLPFVNKIESLITEQKLPRVRTADGIRIITGLWIKP